MNTSLSAWLPYSKISYSKIFSPEGTTLLYLAGAAVGVYVDWVAALLIESGLGSPLSHAIQEVVFVAGTALLLYLLLRSRQATIDASQAKLQASHAELQAEKRRHEALIEASPVPIVALDLQGRVTTWSPAAEEVLGWHEGEVLGAQPPFVPPDQQGEFKDLLGRVLQGETFHGVEARRRRKDGSPIHVSLSAAPISNGRVHGVEAVIVDITDQKRYEEGLIEAREEAERARKEAERARDRAEEMSRLKSSFLANMSHEIRTPLTAIMGFADMMRDGSEGEARENAELIYQSSERLFETLTSVLDLARFESETPTLRPERLDLREFVQETIEPYRCQAERQGLRLRCELPAGPIYARLDPAALRRVLTNLVSNAIKFTREGGVTVALRREGNEAALQVADTGVGIQEDFLPKIFEAFDQESSGLGREFEGSGLGLTIADRLARAMGGHIDVESEKGRGSIFEVRLPAGKMVEDEAAPNAVESKNADARTTFEVTAPEKGAMEGASRPLPEGTSGRPWPRGERVLLVEDNPANRQLVAELLGPEVTLDMAPSGREALQLARQRRYDTVLLDIGLGVGPSGEDVLQVLRALPGYDQAAIIAVTAHAMPGDRERFLEAGFDGYLAKPFGDEQLTQAVRMATCVARVRRRAEAASESLDADTLLARCQGAGVIERYAHSGETVTMVQDGITFRLPRREAQDVLDLLMREA